MYLNLCMNIRRTTPPLLFYYIAKRHMGDLKPFSNLVFFRFQIKYTDNRNSNRYQYLRWCSKGLPSIFNPCKYKYIAFSVTFRFIRSFWFYCVFCFCFVFLLFFRILCVVNFFSSVALICVPHKSIALVINSINFWQTKCSKSIALALECVTTYALWFRRRTYGKGRGQRASCIERLWLMLWVFFSFFFFSFLILL